MFKIIKRKELQKVFGPICQDYEANKRDKESERPQGPNLGQQ